MKRAPRGPNSLALVAAAALVVVLLAAAAPPAAAAVVALPLSLREQGAPCSCTFDLPPRPATPCDAAAARLLAATRGSLR